ncbi:hypothetical protein J6590_000312 [Homalodisca vitripennis]|nr:hypothetical protein J6590_000312 [Homalodisca vitripennis]
MSVLSKAQRIRESQIGIRPVMPIDRKLPEVVISRKRRFKLIPQACRRRRPVTHPAAATTDVHFSLFVFELTRASPAALTPRAGFVGMVTNSTLLLYNSGVDTCSHRRFHGEEGFVIHPSH